MVPILIMLLLQRITLPDSPATVRFCRAHPVEPEARCHGIGPLHIPPPPSVMLPRPGGGGDSPHDRWWKSLSGRQRQYIRRVCNDEDNGMSTLCGGTPLVVAWHGETVAFTDAHWPTTATPWIALDRDGDGAITSSAELFGSDTTLSDGAKATDGFAALRALDANADGVIDARDPAFSSLVLWSDRDGDGRSSPGELAPLATAIDAISLDVTLAPRCDAQRDCERERASIVWHDRDGTHTGAAVDVHLPYR